MNAYSKLKEAVNEIGLKEAIGYIADIAYQHAVELRKQNAPIAAMLWETDALLIAQLKEKL